MAAPGRYGEEVRERATRMTVDARRDAVTGVGVIRRMAQRGRENGELRRAREIRTTSAVSFAAAELDRRITAIGHSGQTPRPPDLAERGFVAGAPDRLWVAGLTDIGTFTSTVLAESGTN